MHGKPTEEDYWRLHLSYCHSVVFNVIMGIIIFVDYYIKPLLGGRHGKIITAQRRSRGKRTCRYLAGSWL